MSTPDEVVAARLADGLDVAGQTEAGVYGDPAGAGAPPAVMDLSAATAAATDIDALRARLASLEAAQAAAVVPPSEPEAPDLTPVLSGSTGSDVRAAFQSLHERLVAVEKHLGL
jgi:hypothetical protein